MSNKMILPQGFAGSLDDLDELKVRGWLLNTFAPAPIPFQVRSGETIAYRGATGHRRPDLEQLNPLHRVAGLLIDLRDLDLVDVLGDLLEIWTEDLFGSPWFKAFEFTLPSGFLEKSRTEARRCVDERNFSAKTVFAEDIRYMLNTFVIRNSPLGTLLNHYQHSPAPIWPSAASDLYVDLSRRSEISGDRLIDLLKGSSPADIDNLFDKAVETSASGCFDSSYYLDKNYDVAQALNPILHFILYGRKENRPFRYSPLRKSGFEMSFFSSYFDSVLESGTHSSPSPVAVEHVLQVMRKSMEGAAYYGDEEIEADSKFFSFLSGFQPAKSDVEEAMFEASTDYITETYLSKSDANYAPIPALAADAFNAARPRSTQCKIVASPQSGGVSILTCYYRHLEYFSQAALSVAATMAATKRVIPWMHVEWIVINDDPSTSNEDLLKMVPPEIQLVTRIIANEANEGIVLSQNRALQEAQYEWMLMLDCDDMLFPACLMVMDHYHRIAPARYYSSRCIDIGQNNEILRFRHRHLRQMDEITSGLQASHLKMIHRSVFSDIGNYPIYAEGCQDYWLVLELCKRERIVYLSEYLYYYRWHDSSQSASNALLQAATTRRVKKMALKSTADFNFPELRRPLPEARESARHGVIIRTVGDRILELKEAILSCTALSSLQVTAVVVVHGNDEIVAFVRDQLVDLPCSNYAILPAYDGISKRGQPLNIGINYLLEIGADAISILDDDDILLPPMFIAAQMVIDAARENTEIAYIAVGRSLLKDGKDLIVQHHPRSAETIFAYNFITTNSIVISKCAARNALAEFGTIFPPDMHYLEDWLGFMRLVAGGARIVYLDDFVGQYSGGSDGNVDFKALPIEHQTCVAKAQFQARILGRKWRDKGGKPATPFTFY